MVEGDIVVEAADHHVDWRKAHPGGTSTLRAIWLRSLVVSLGAPELLILTLLSFGLFAAVVGVIVFALVIATKNRD